MVSSRRNPEDDPCADGERHHRCRSWLPKPAHWPRDGRGLDEGRLMRAIQIGASSGVSVRSEECGGKIKAAHRHRVGESGERGGDSVPPSRVGLLAWLAMDGPSRPKKCTYNLRVQTHANKKQKAAPPSKV